MDAGGETEEGENILGAPSANVTVMVRNCSCSLCNTSTQPTGVQKQAEQRISGNSVQAVSLLLLVRVPQRYTNK